MKFLLPVCIVVLAVLQSCNKQEASPSPSVDENETYSLTNVLPEYRGVENDTVRIALYPHARLFYLDMKKPAGVSTLNSILTAEKLGVQIRVRVYKRPHITAGDEIAGGY